MDNLKDLWEKEETKLQASASLTLQKQTSTGIVEKIYRTLKKENYIHIVVAILSVIWIIAGNHNLVFGGLIILLLAPIIVYYFYVISKVKPDSFSSDVHSHLIYIHRLYKSFVNRYRVLSVLYILIGIFLIPLIIFMNSFSHSPFSYLLIWVFLVAIALILIALSESYIYFFHKKNIIYLKTLIKKLEMDNK